MNNTEIFYVFICISKHTYTSNVLQLPPPKNFGYGTANACLVMID